MNERIRELAHEAGAIEAKHITNIPKAPSLNGEEIEKFAELIVRECIKVIDDKPIFGSQPIKEHFGVEL